MWDLIMSPKKYQTVKQKRNQPSNNVATFYNSYNQRQLLQHNNIDTGDNIINNIFVNSNDRNN